MDPGAQAKSSGKGVGIVRFVKRSGELKVHSTVEGNVASLMVGVKDGSNFPKARPLQKHACVTEDQPFQKSFVLSKPLRKGTRVREIRKNGGEPGKAVSEGATAAQESTPGRIVPPLRFFRKRAGKGKPFRADSLRKHFLRRELTLTNY